MPRPTKKRSTNSRPRGRKNGKQQEPIVSSRTIEQELATPTPIERRKRSRDSQPRTASGKKSDAQLLAAAAIGAQEGLRERTEAGHLWAGRTPPSQSSGSRNSGAARLVDDAIR